VSLKYELVKLNLHQRSKFVNEEATWFVLDWSLKDCILFIPVNQMTCIPMLASRYSIKRHINTWEDLLIISAISWVLWFKYIGYVNLLLFLTVWVLQFKMIVWVIGILKRTVDDWHSDNLCRSHLPSLDHEDGFRTAFQPHPACLRMV